MIKIGIDLSSTKTGVCVLGPRNDLMLNYVISLDFKKTINCVVSQLNMQLSPLVDIIMKKENIMIGIELSNFSNPKLTQRFSLLAGMIISHLQSIRFDTVIQYKMFNCNQWQKLVGCKPSDKREVRKLKARQFAKSKGVFNVSQDEADAYCIAYFLEDLISTEQSEIEHKQKKISQMKKVKDDLKRQMMVSKRLIQINKLDKVKNKKKIETLKNEIYELGYDIEAREWKN